MSCTVLKIKPFKEFTGCDGKVWDDEFLRWHIENALKDESYEWAAKCKKELDRRQRKKVNLKAG